MRRSASAAILAVILGVPAAAAAQGGPGFLFRQPRLTIGVRAGYVVPKGGGQLFDYALDEFIESGADTLSSMNFNGPYLGGELAYRPTDRWDVVASLGWTRSRTLTEYRRWVDSSDNPIEQETTFQVVTGTVGVKYYFEDRGRRVGSLAWVPHRLAPYVSAGVGLSGYEFTQEGDLLDLSTLEISYDQLHSRRVGFAGYGSAGADLTLAKHVLLTGEARYSLAKAGVNGSYRDFDSIDLGGMHFLLGLGFQF